MNVGTNNLHNITTPPSGIDPAAFKNLMDMLRLTLNASAGVSSTKPSTPGTSVTGLTCPS
ncbi:hypothetical protein GCK32_021401, partial [Trichostrongylus colubriformis]